MSVATHLKMISLFDRWAHGQEPTSALLHTAMDFIRAEVPEALSLRLYHLNEHGVLLGASTVSPRDSQLFISVSDESLHTTALAHRQPIFDPKRMTWLAPLESENTSYGLLEISVMRQPIEAESLEYEERRDWIALVAAHTSQALDTRTLQEISRKQVQTSGELTEARSYSEIARILAKHLIREDQFITINLITYHPNGDYRGFRVVISANRREVFANEVALQDLDASETQVLVDRAIEQARPFLVSDVRSSVAIGDQLRAWLQSYQVVGVCMFPMRFLGTTFGFIALDNVAHPLYLSEAEITLYQSLADQVSTLVRLGQVTEQIDLTQAISERQKRAFNELVAGQDYVEMAAIIARHMLPEKGRFIIINELVYDTAGALTAWKPLASANRTVSYRSQSDDIPPVELKQLAPPLLNSIRDGEPFMADEDPTSALEDRVGKALAGWLRTNEILHYLSLPVLLNERPIALLAVLSKSERPFTREEIDAFTNITGQMAVLIQVRYLLDQARSARNLVDQLVLANRLVTVSDAPGFIAQSVVYTLARNLRGAAITLFDTTLDEMDTPHARRRVGLYFQDEIVPVDAVAYTDHLPDEAQINRLRAGQPVIRLQPPEFRDLNLGKAWCASFGLRAGSQLLGTLDLLDDQPHVFSSEEIDSYATLADQIGITLRSRQLVEQANTAQSIAAQLVQTNLQISTAQTYDEMAQAVVKNLPEAVASAIILLFNEPLALNEVPKWIRMEVIATRDTVETPDVVDYVATSEDTEQSLGLRAILSGEPIVVEDSRQFPFRLIVNTVEYLAEKGIYSFIAIGLRTGGRCIGLLALGAENFSALGDVRGETLRAVASQIAVAIENRILVNQTADALSFVGLQYQVSNALYRAQQPTKMLAALFQFVQHDYTQARLGIIDQNSTAARIIVEMNADGDYNSAQRRTGALYSTPVTRTVLMQDQIILSDDARTLTLPLVTITDQLVGVVQFLNEHQPVVLPLDVVRALRTLADQMTTSLQNYYLLSQMEEGLEEARLLYDANRALLSAGDTENTLQVLRDVIAKDADYITLVSVGYDMMTGEVNSYRLEIAISAQGVVKPARELAPVIGAEGLREFKASWDAQGDEIEFVEDVSQGGVAESILGFYKSAGVQVASSIAMPILEDGILVQLINISFSQPKYFDNPVRRLYAALRDQITIVLQNQHLIRDTRASAAQLGNQVRVLQTLNQFALYLSTSTDEVEFLNQACEAFCNALRVDHVGITLLNPDGLSATVVADYPPQNLVGLQIEDTNELQVKMRTTRQMFYLPEVANAMELAEVSRVELSKLGLQTMLLLPILDSNDQYFGGVGLEYYQKGREFTPEMMDIARTISVQVALGLQNIRETQKTQRQARQLQELASFSQTLQTQLEVPSILETLATEAPNILALDHFSIILYDSVTNTLRLALQWNNGMLYRVTTNTPIVVEGTTAGAAWKGRDLIYLPHLRKETELVHTFNSQMLSVMGIPVFARGTALGVIEISSLQPYVYNDTDQLVFRQLASLVGAALENAETYTQSQRLARSKALVNEISSQIQKQVDLDSILNVTVTELGRALGAKQARLRLGTQHTGDTGGAGDGENSEQW
jgi:GAF domain-containing protein